MPRLEGVYVDTCWCPSETRASWWKPVFLKADQEQQAIELHQSRRRPLIMDFYNTSNEQRYWAIHVGGRHLIGVRARR